MPASFRWRDAYPRPSAWTPAFREELEEAGGLPRFVVREFEDYLQCWILEGAVCISSADKAE